MLCLGIESSCDETALALVRDGRILGQTLASQVELHALFGGVVPELASREHGKVLAPLYDLLLKNCGISAGQLEGVAVARGPGLLGSLLVGVAFAKALAWALDKPIIGVNHLHAHVLAVGLERPLLFPALALLVSGGHTHIYLARSPADFVLLGRSLDDAAGEALDKFGKLMGLPYPAGREIDRLGASGRLENFFTCPYLQNDNLDFSFSGLKTAARLLLKEKGFKAEKAEKNGFLADVCASFAHTVALTLAVKTERAFRRLDPGTVKAVILAGGVAANSRVRERFGLLAEELGLPLLVPSPGLCTDNAAMIAYAGEIMLGDGFRHDLDFEVIPRGRKVPDDYRRNLG
ncbi:MAG: tRNA (adenosine(37)-N6)-threonylcarbamoyltransferase complex transferase subunit TsaD [Desulfovibrionaceae bacterium]|nr:tRNA (adenosine(37)-N6)-threonylcarbamoyltransferase complex transferase subunit TsaD [Desulfovibrionaceae bacterium]